MVNWWFGATCGLDSIAGIPFHKRILSESKAPGPKQNQCTISWIVMNKRNINLFFNRKKKMQFYFLRLNISPENEREYPHENQWGFKSTWNVPLFWVDISGQSRPKPPCWPRGNLVGHQNPSEDGNSWRSGRVSKTPKVSLLSERALALFQGMTCFFETRPPSLKFGRVVKGEVHSIWGGRAP